MMDKKIFCTLLLIHTIPLAMSAQNFATAQAEYLYSLFGGKCNLPNTSAIFESPMSEHHLSVKYNNENEVRHLGVSLFNEDYSDYFGETICEFHERIFLELSLLSDMKINEACKEYGLGLFAYELTGNKILSRKDINFIINFISQDNLTFILVRDSLYWTSTWQDMNKDKKIEFRFPATFNLISGMDKKEADIIFEKKITEHLAKQSPPVLLLLNRAELKRAPNGLFVKTGKNMFIESMMSNLYFDYEQGTGYSLIFNTTFPQESISNLFIYPDNNTQNLSIDIEHRIYGNDTRNYRFNLYDFLTFLNDDFETFIGIEKSTKEELNFTVLFRSKYYNCHHLLYVETFPNTMFTAKGSLIGTLYTYIPNHNIKNLFEKKIDNKNLRTFAN